MTKPSSKRKLRRVGKEMTMRGRKERRPLHAPPAPNEEMVSVPLSWFLEPVRNKMRKLVRPPTARTRRKQLVIKERVPIQVLWKMLEPFESGSISGLEWEDPEDDDEYAPTPEELAEEEAEEPTMLEHAKFWDNFLAWVREIQSEWDNSDTDEYRRMRATSWFNHARQCARDLPEICML